MIFNYLLLFLMFTYLGGMVRERQGEGENLKQAPHCQLRACHGARTHEP